MRQFWPCMAEKADWELKHLPQILWSTCGQVTCQKKIDRLCTILPRYVRG